MQDSVVLHCCIQTSRTFAKIFPAHFRYSPKHIKPSSSTSLKLDYGLFKGLRPASSSGYYERGSTSLVHSCDRVSTRLLAGPVVNEQIFKCLEGIQAELHLVNKNLRALARSNEQQLNSMACIISGREPDPVLFQFLPDELRVPYDRAWAQYTEYHAKMDRDLEAWRARQAAKDAEKDQRQRELDELAEKLEREEAEARASTSAASARQEAPVPPTGPIEAIPLRSVPLATPLTKKDGEEEEVVVDLTVDPVLDIAREHI